MEYKNIEDRFEAVEDDYRMFERVCNKNSRRPDLHAFILLDKLSSGVTRDIISAASHDVIFLDVDADKIESLTDSQILELVQCGVMYDSDHDCLSMLA
jgi:hypothetical protein